MVSRHPNELPGYDRAVFVASLAAEELPSTLEAACSNGAKLVCVHDRPEKSELGVDRYLIELEHEGGFTDDEIARIEHDSKLKCLGCCAHVEG